MARKLSTSRGSTGFPSSGVCDEPISGRAASNAKLTMIALLVRRKSRLFIAASLRLRRAEHRGENSCVCRASAQISSQRLLYLFKRGVRRLAEQRLGSHDHSIRAVSTLRGLFRNECGLHRIRLLWRAESFDRRNCVSFRLLYWSDARTSCFAVNQYRACPALTKAAAEFRPMQPKRVPKHIQ